jgi:hypothetical protein
MVVRFQGLGWRPCRPAARISRQTRLRATRTPWTTSRPAGVVGSMSDPRTSAMITPASRHASTSASRSRAVRASRSSAHATTTSTLPARTVSSSARNCGRGFRPDLAARVQAAADTDPSARAVLAALAAVRAELGAMALEPPPPQFVQRWADAIGPAGGVRLQGPGPRQRRRRRARPPWNAATPSTPRNSPPPPPGSSLGPGGVCAP